MSIIQPSDRIPTAPSGSGKDLSDYSRGVYAKFLAVDKALTLVTDRLDDIGGGDSDDGDDGGGGGGGGGSSSSLPTGGTANQVLGKNAAATSEEWKTISGTANRVTVSHSAGAITLTGPQDLHTGADPTFSHLHLTSTPGIDATAIGSGSTIIYYSTRTLVSDTYAIDAMARDIAGNVHFTVIGSGTSAPFLGCGINGENYRRFAIRSNGDMRWGGGTVDVDTTLSRSGSGVLALTGGLTISTTLAVSGTATFSGLIVTATAAGEYLRFSTTTLSSSGTEGFVVRDGLARDGSNNTFISIIGSTAGVTAYNGAVSGDTYRRFTLQCGGRMDWGPGSGARDTTLARSAAATLALTGALTISTTLAVSGATSLLSTLAVTGATTFDSTVAVKGGSSSGNIAKVGGRIFAYNSDAGNNTATGETDLYTDSVPASTLSVDKASLEARYGGTITGGATKTARVRVYFGGTAILDTTALTYSGTNYWEIVVSIVRVSSTTVRYIVRFHAATGTTTIVNIIASGQLAGLTLSNANTLKITGLAGGAGAANNDILAQSGHVSYMPAP